MKLNKCLSSLVILLFLCIGSVYSAVEIWISKNGKDTNIGNRENPLATLNMALRKARNMRRLNDPSIKGGIHIILMDGTYFLDEPVFIRSEDSGTKESPTIIKSKLGAKPVLSGGTEITGWQPTQNAINGIEAGKIWVADAPTKAGSL